MKRMLLDRRKCLQLVTTTHPNTKPVLPLTGKRPKQQQRAGRHHSNSTPFTPTRYQGPLLMVLQRVCLRRTRLVFYTVPPRMQQFPWIPSTTFAWLSPIRKGEKNRRANKYVQPVIRVIGVSHTACKDEFRQNLRSHSWSVFLFL